MFSDVSLTIQHSLWQPFGEYDKNVTIKEVSSSYIDICGCRQSLMIFLKICLDSFNHVITYIHCCPAFQYTQDQRLKIAPSACIKFPPTKIIINKTRENVAKNRKGVRNADCRPIKALFFCSSSTFSDATTEIYLSVL